MTPTPTSRTVQSIDIPLGPARQTLRVTLTRDSEGHPEALVLAAGFGGGDTDEPFHRPTWCDGPLHLPADAIDGLREALDALAGSAER